MDEIQALHLRQNNAEYLVYYTCKNIAIMKTFNVLKHKKSRVHFLET